MKGRGGCILIHWHSAQPQRGASDGHSSYLHIGEGCSPRGLCAVKPTFCLLGQCVGICFEWSYFGSKERVLHAKSLLSAVGWEKDFRARVEMEVNLVKQVEHHVSSLFWLFACLTLIISGQYCAIHIQSMSVGNHMFVRFQGFQLYRLGNRRCRAQP